MRFRKNTCTCNKKRTFFLDMFSNIFCFSEGPGGLKKSEAIDFHSIDPNSLEPV